MSLMKYTTKVALYNSYFDLNNNINAKSILNIFQDVASIHAEDIGVGYLTMLNKNFYWVLSRIKFDIIQMPEINQVVIVETWPHKKGIIDFDRDYLIKSLSGEILIKGTSKWCVIDTINRALQRTENINYVGDYVLDVNYQEKFGKIILPDCEPTKTFTHTVMFSDLDHNNHMNNTNYANLVLNAVNNKKLTHFEINFNNECVLNDQIDVFLAKENEKEYVVGKINNKTSFTSLIY